MAAEQVQWNYQGQINGTMGIYDALPIVASIFDLSRRVPSRRNVKQSDRGTAADRADLVA